MRGHDRLLSINSPSSSNYVSIVAIAISGHQRLGGVKDPIGIHLQLHAVLLLAADRTVGRPGRVNVLLTDLAGRLAVLHRQTKGLLIERINRVDHQLENALAELGATVEDGRRHLSGKLKQVSVCGECAGGWWFDWIR